MTHLHLRLVNLRDCDCVGDSHPSELMNRNSSKVGPVPVFISQSCSASALLMWSEWPFDVNVVHNVDHNVIQNCLKGQKSHSCLNYERHC